MMLTTMMTFVMISSKKPAQNLTGIYLCNTCYPHSYPVFLICHHHLKISKCKIIPWPTGHYPSSKPLATPQLSQLLCRIILQGQILECDWCNLWHNPEFLDTNSEIKFHVTCFWSLILRYKFAGEILGYLLCIPKSLDINSLFSPYFGKINPEVKFCVVPSELQSIFK